jgi:hypothetical protein
MNLKQLLEELDIDTSEVEEGSDKEENKIDPEKLSESEKKIYQALSSENEELKNEVSKRDILIDAMKKAQANIHQPKDKKEGDEEEKEEKILGLLDKDDQYAPAFSKLANMIVGVAKKSQVTEEKSFKEGVVDFAKKNKDIVRYVKEMDELLVEHPTLKKDIPKLYKLAKNTAEERGKLKKNDKTQFVTERSGVSSSNVTDMPGSKTISEAFELAEKKVVGGK